jgi:hypothetical protein
VRAVISSEMLFSSIHAFGISGVTSVSFFRPSNPNPNGKYIPRKKHAKRLVVVQTAHCFSNPTMGLVH